MKAKEDIKDDKEQSEVPDTKQQLSGESDEGVHVTEEYQKQAHALIGKADKHQVAHVRSRVNDREEELRKAEMKKDKPSKGKPEVFDATSSPSY